MTYLGPLGTCMSTNTCPDEDTTVSGGLWVDSNEEPGGEVVVLPVVLPGLRLRPLPMLLVLVPVLVLALELVL